MQLTKTEQELIDLINQRGGWCWRSIIDCNFDRPDAVLRSLQQKRLIRRAMRDDRVGVELINQGTKQ